ncbi:MAG TPA: RsmE family RNA methyltransferase [Candidatus Binataceae bacterium]|nr:RsmE family RNA methyltransferase [Candidatus Binataceae bacterium]
MIVALDAVDAHHAANVLRCKVGDPLTLVSSGVAWDAEVASASKKGVDVRAVRTSDDQGGELPSPVVVLQALTKGAKFDEVVEKTVELGVARIVPVICARSEAEGNPHKLERWQRVVRAAAMQSRRRMVPVVEPAMGWADALARFAPGSFALVAFEGAPARSLGNAMQSYRAGSPVVIAIGPEGGLEVGEVETAHGLDAHVVSLGPTILRTETAAPALLAALASSAGWW